MKTVYSLREFREQVLEIAKLVKEEYVTVGVEMDAYEKCTFRCYVNGYNAHSGNTMEESLSKLREKISPLPPANIDVEVEIHKAVDEVTAFNSIT